jgi:hypothetical protein
LSFRQTSCCVVGRARRVPLGQRSLRSALTRDAWRTDAPRHNVRSSKLVSPASVVEAGLRRWPKVRANDRRLSCASAGTTQALSTPIRLNVIFVPRSSSPNGVA